jgi:hypothetical protein
MQAQSIYSHNTQKPYLILYAVVVTLFVAGFPLVESLAFLLFFHQLFTLFYSIGKIMPVRALIGTLFTFQLLVGPIIAYNGGDDYVIEAYKMKVDEATYYSILLPATFFFILGLNIFSTKSQGETLNIDSIKELRKAHPYLPHYLIAIGIGANLLEPMVSSDLKFVLYIIGLLRYIGVFISIIGDKKLNIWMIVVVYGGLLVMSGTSGMFHDLLTWSIFLGSILLIKYKINNLLKLTILISFFVVAVFIQFVKQDYRESLYNGADAGIESVSDVFSETTKENGSMFKKENLFKNSVRINQGYIVSSVINNVPANVPYSEGEAMKQVLLSALVPRFLYPDKLNAGDQKIFIYFSGMQLSEGTSMGLSSIGDGYANFGKVGSWLFMFLYGLLFNGGLHLLHKRSRITPVILLFSPIIYIYPIRPDCELQTILGHFFKATFVLLVIFSLYKRKFILGSNQLRNAV